MSIKKKLRAQLFKKIEKKGKKIKFKVKIPIHDKFD